MLAGSRQQHFHAIADRIQSFTALQLFVLPLGVELLYLPLLFRDAQLQCFLEFVHAAEVFLQNDGAQFRADVNVGVPT